MYISTKISVNIFKTLVLWSIFLFSCRLYSQTFEIKKAVELREKGRCEKAVKILKNAKNKYRNNPEILYEIALTYLKIDDIKERIYASDYLERAMKLDPENENYILTYAKLKKRQGFTDTAEKMLLKLSEIDSKNTEVMLETAEIYLEQAIWHDRMKKHYRAGMAGVPVTIHLDDFARNNFKRAKNLLNRVLKLENENAEALYDLGRLFFYEKNWEKMQELFSEAVKSRPDFKDAHLFLGYTYYMQKDYENALKSFEEAKKYMSEEELSVMESFNRVYYNNTENDSSYWTKRNPSYLTGINLRKLEHYARMAYANLLYTKSKMNLPGWKTERGQVLIRFDEPLFSAKTAPEVDAKVSIDRGFKDQSYNDKNGIVVEGLKGPVPKGYISTKTGDGYFKFATEFWAYENFALGFEDRYLSRNFTLDNNSKWAYDQIIKKNPEIYDHPFKNIKFHFPYYYALFKGKDNLQLDVYYSIPEDSIKTQISGVENFEILQGCYIMSENWDKIGEAVSERELINTPEEMVSVVCMEVKSGKFNLAVEFLEKNNKFFGQEKFPVDIKAFENNLCISDIIIGIPSETLPDKNEGKAFQNGILPRPNLEFNEKKIRIFFEVYNLALADGFSNFKVITSISTQKKKKKGFAKLAESFVNIFKGKMEAEISNSYSYRGDSKNDNIVLNIDIAFLKSGKYDLNIELTDMNEKKSTQTKRSFLVK